MCYLEHGWQPVPIPAKSKAPVIADWPKFRVNGNSKDFFSGPGNIGVLLGKSSGGLVDIDLDSPEAIRIARRFLPVTAAVFGRLSKPQSHHLYLVQPLPATVRFSDTDGSSLLELRSSGAQTIFPPSTHPSGETVSWVDEFAPEPAQVDSKQLLHAVRCLAAATLLVRHYPAEGSRHEFALALSGALARAEWRRADQPIYRGHRRSRRGRGDARAGI
jgi:hypothetical protein